jgi:hypothetical protein
MHHRQPLYKPGEPGDTAERSVATGWAANLPHRTEACGGEGRAQAVEFIVSSNEQFIINTHDAPAHNHCPHSAASVTDHTDSAHAPFAISDGQIRYVA